MSVPPLPSDNPPVFEPGELADRALQLHRRVLFQRWATLRSAASALVMVAVLGITAAILFWPYAMVGAALAVLVVGVSGSQLMAARSRWEIFPFRYEKMSFFSSERRSPTGARALAIGAPVLGALIGGAGAQRGWAAVAGAAVCFFLVLPAVIPFLPSWQQRGRIVDRYLAKHPEQIQVIATLTSYPMAPWSLPEWLAGWRTGTPVAPYQPGPPR